jgi:hypothetical protein
MAEKLGFYAYRVASGDRNYCDFGSAVIAGAIESKGPGKAYRLPQ